MSCLGWLGLTAMHSTVPLTSSYCGTVEVASISLLGPCSVQIGTPAAVIASSVRSASRSTPGRARAAFPDCRRSARRVDRPRVLHPLSQFLNATGQLLLQQVE